MLVLGVVLPFLAIVTIVGVVVHAYSHMQVTCEARRVAPHLQTGLWSIGKLVLYMLQHQWLSVATELLKSMHWRIEGLVTIRNASLVPLFVPAMRHQMFVKQQPIGGWISTGGFWLKPRGVQVLPIAMEISAPEIMRACQSAIPDVFKEGAVSWSVKSTLFIGPFSTSRVSSGRVYMKPPSISAIPRLIRAILPTRRVRKS